MKTSTRLFSALRVLFAMVLLSQAAPSSILVGGSHWLGLAEETSAFLEETSDAGFFLNEANFEPFAGEAFSVVVGVAAHRLDLTDAVEARQGTFPTHHSRDPPRT